MAEEEQNLLSKTGDFLYDSFIWDDDAPTWMNVASTALNIASVATVALTLGAGTPFAAGMQAGRVALVQGAKSVAKKAAVKTATKAATKIVAKTATKEAAKETAEATLKKGILSKVFGSSNSSYITRTRSAKYIGAGLIGGIVLDNQTGSKGATALGRVAASDSWYAPVTQAGLWGIEGIARIYNAISSAPAAATSAALIGGLEEKNVLNPDDSSYAVKKKIIQASTQALAGNVIEVGNILYGTDMQAADVIAAYKTAKEQEPDDTFEQGKIVLDLLGDKIKRDKAPKEDNTTSLETTFDQARENTGNILNVPTWLKNIPILGWIIDKLVKFTDYISNLFSGADKGNLDAQGGHRNRLAKMMDKNGHNPVAGANITLKSHDNEDLENIALNTDKQQQGPTLAPAVQ